MPYYRSLRANLICKSNRRIAALPITQVPKGFAEMFEGAFLFLNDVRHSELLKGMSKPYSVASCPFSCLPLRTITFIKILELLDQIGNNVGWRPITKLRRIGPCEGLQHRSITVGMTDVRDAQNLESIHVLGIRGNSRQVIHCRYNQ